MKILCIGRNYSEHVAELKNEMPEEPVFFGKPDSSVLLPRHPFYIPDFSNDIHHEIELVVRINRLGKHIGKRFAHKYYAQVTVGIDFTARDVQTELKKKGLPWDKAKGFDGSAVVGDWVELSSTGKDIQDLNFELRVNGEIRQSGNTSQMIFGVDDLIARLSTYNTLRQGDIIFTGTPAGVSAVHPGDILEGFLEGKKLFTVDVK